MAAAWMTDAALALVREMALANGSNKAIAQAVTKQFGSFVNGSMIAGTISRMKLPRRVHSRTGYVAPPRGIAPPPRPALPVTASTFTHHVTAQALAGAQHVTRDDLPKLAAHANGRWSVAAMIRLVDFYRFGFSYANIGTEMQRSEVAIRRKTERLTTAGILVARPSDRGGPQKRMEVVVRKPVVRSPAPEPEPSRMFKVNRGVAPSTLQWLAPKGIATAAKPPRCTWSGCDVVADGKWCTGHADLLRQPAQDITQALGTWR